MLTVALAYVVPEMGDELIELPTTIWGVIGGPLFGVFVLAIFVPFSNAAVKSQADNTVLIMYPRKCDSLNSYAYRHVTVLAELFVSQ